MTYPPPKIGSGCMLGFRHDEGNPKTGPAISDYQEKSSTTGLNAIRGDSLVFVFSLLPWACHD